MKNSTRALIGFVAWLGFVVAARTTPMSDRWTDVLLTFAALVLVPLVLDLVVERRDTGQIASAMRWATMLQLPAAACLALAFGLRPGLLALFAALPWMVVTALLASVGLARLMRDTWARPIDRLSVDVGLVYLSIGGLWLLLDRAGVHPLRFSSDIVALTAVHFHFAGLMLPVFAGQVARVMEGSRLAARGIIGVILGVPAVGLGITVTQLGWAPAFEAAAGCGLALAGCVVALLHVRWAMDARDQSPLARALLGLSGVSLFFAMVLAAAYAIRAFAVPVPTLNLPQMRAFHGTLNAFGFALCGALGWRLVTLKR